MIDRELDIATPDGAMNTFITHPEEGGPHPAVIFYMDAPGKREELHDMARRLGSAGYYVILPNLYYRRSRDFKLTPGGGEAERAVMFEHMRAITRADILADTRALLNVIDHDPAARQGTAAAPAKVGVVGYCMSGPFVFWATEANPARVAATASLYGVNLCTDAPDSPHRDAHLIQGEVYVGAAETDVWAPTEMIAALDAHLKSTGIRYRVETYPGTHHGFAFPKRGADIYDKAAAERHWERLHALFERNLKR
jgi:carboxymethylenebutenolidase